LSLALLAFAIAGMSQAALMNPPGARQSGHLVTLTLAQRSRRIDLRHPPPAG
jgi:hypothetical protein